MQHGSAAAERMRLAFELAELGEAMFRQRLRRDRPQLSESEIDSLAAAPARCQKVAYR